jgi:hypothetical protein
MGKRNPKKAKPSIFKRWYVYKYSGLITTPLVFAAILIPFFAYTSTLDFYDGFTCNGLIIYKINNVPLEDNPTYNEFTQDQKNHYDNILEQCKQGEYNMWFYHQTPVVGENKKILENEIVLEGKNPNPLEASHEDFGG